MGVGIDFGGSKIEQAFFEGQIDSQMADLTYS